MRTQSPGPGRPSILLKIFGSAFGVWPGLRQTESGTHRRTGPYRGVPQVRPRQRLAPAPKGPPRGGTSGAPGGERPEGEPSGHRRAGHHRAGRNPNGALIRTAAQGPRGLHPPGRPLPCPGGGRPPRWKVERDGETGPPVVWDRAWRTTATGANIVSEQADSGETEALAGAGRTDRGALGRPGRGGRPDRTSACQVPKHLHTRLTAAWWPVLSGSIIEAGRQLMQHPDLEWGRLSAVVGTL